MIVALVFVACNFSPAVASLLLVRVVQLFFMNRKLVFSINTCVSLRYDFKHHVKLVPCAFGW